MIEVDIAPVHIFDSVSVSSEAKDFQKKYLNFLSRLQDARLAQRTLNAKSPNCVYSLRSIAGQDIKTGKPLLSISFPTNNNNGERLAPDYDEENNPMLMKSAKFDSSALPVEIPEFAIELIEEETIIKRILLSEITTNEILADENGRKLKLIYLYEREKKKSGFSPTASQNSAAKLFVIILTFHSAADCAEAHNLIGKLGTLWRAGAWKGLSVGQICLHSGWMEKKRNNALASWVKRFFRLYNNRLICYRNSKSAVPVNIYVLSHENPAVPVIIRPIKQSQFSLEPGKLLNSSAPPESKPIILRCLNEMDRTKWLQALEIAEKYSHASSLNSLLDYTHFNLKKELGIEETTQEINSNNINDNNNNPNNNYNNNYNNSSSNVGHNYNQGKILSAQNNNNSASKDLDQKQLSFSSRARRSTVPDRPSSLIMNGTNPLHLAAHAEKTKISVSSAAFAADVGRFAADQRALFAFLITLRTRAIVWHTNVAKLAEFQRETKENLLKKRGKLMLKLDYEVESYAACVEVISELLEHSKLLCYDAGNSAGANSQVQFVYPGEIQF
jgi:hypothetical protein